MYNADTLLDGKLSRDGITTRCEIRSKGDESRHITFCFFDLVVNSIFFGEELHVFELAC
jgi:hypothetical protein